MRKKENLRKVIGGILAIVGLAAASIGNQIISGNVCGCQGWICSCYPPGTPAITPQQQTPVPVTLPPYASPAPVTPALPNPPTPVVTLPPTPVFITLPPNPVLPTWTPFPAPPTATPLPTFIPPGTLPAPSVGFICRFVVYRDPNVTSSELYIVIFNAPENPTPTLTASVGHSALYQGYYSNYGHVWLLEITHPYPPTVFSAIVTQGIRVFSCPVNRSPV